MPGMCFPNEEKAWLRSVTCLVKVYYCLCAWSNRWLYFEPRVGVLEYGVNTPIIPRKSVDSIPECYLLPTLLPFCLLYADFVLAALRLKLFRRSILGVYSLVLQTDNLQIWRWLNLYTFLYREFCLVFMEDKPLEVVDLYARGSVTLIACYIVTRQAWILQWQLLEISG